MIQQVLTVVIPAYNEGATLARVVNAVLRQPSVQEIIIVDDGSTDGTPAAADQLAAENGRVRVIHHSRNQGKTAALRTGIAGSQGEIIIVQDADLEYNPEEIPVMIQPILDGNADVVFGSRFLVRKEARVLYFYHFVANKFITLLSNVLTNINLTDVETGYKAVRGDILRQMRIESSGFGFEIEVTAKVAKLHCAIYEVPISYYGRTYEEGKKIGPSDALAAIWYILYYNLFCSLRGSYRQLPELRRDLHHGANRLH